MCGATGGRELAAARIDAGALDEYAFASRKFPEYMHHRLVECPTCDVVYASPVLDLGGIDAAYDAAAFDSKEEATFASRTYAGLVRPLLPRLPRDRRRRSTSAPARARSSRSCSTSASSACAATSPPQRRSPRPPTRARR